MKLREIYETEIEKQALNFLGKGLVSFGAGYPAASIIKARNERKKQRGEQPGAISEFIGNNPALTSLGLWGGWDLASDFLKKKK